MDNKEWLSETLAEKFERQNTLHVGQLVKIGDKEESEITKNKSNRLRTGTIIGLYKHYMLVEFGNSREAFTYVDIVTSILNYADVNNRAGEKLFNAKLKDGYKRITIDMIPFPIKLANEIKRKNGAKGNRRRPYHVWTPEQIKYIVKNKYKFSRPDLVRNFNSKFKTNLTSDQIVSLMFRERGKTV